MLTLDGLPPPLWLTLNDPLLLPIAVGLKATFTLQLAPAAKLVPHVLLAIKKSPVVAIEEIVKID